MCGLNASPAQTSVKPPTSRNNTALHVCWHRGVTVSLDDQILASKVSLNEFKVTLILTNLYSSISESNFWIFIEKIQK